MKKTQYAEGYVSFYQSNGVWRTIMSSTQYVSPTGSKQWRIAIPVPDELLIEELPLQDKIEVNDD